MALIYAALAGLHTLQDFDLWWQLATGRWVIQHHHFFSNDIFSSTAQGAPWIYPVLSGIIFYVVYLAGGYVLLSCLGAISCAATVAILLRRNSFATVALAILAVPLIANRTQPRAEMFTTILFAVFLTLLWRHYRTGHERSTPLWLLPILMVGWVNLHPGFIAGLALCGVYVACELWDLPFAERRAGIRIRLQRAWPWLALTLAATAINPWGAPIYRALLRQQQAQKLHNFWVVEWESLRPSFSSLRQAIDLRDPQSSFWWLLLFALVCAVIALYRKRPGVAILLFSSTYLTVQHVRFQALFACVTAIVGGSLFTEAWATLTALPAAEDSQRKLRVPTPQPQFIHWRASALLAVTFALTALAGVRSWDLVSNRYYLKSRQLSLFGTGVSGWFPERAIDFLQSEKLPANIFNSYNLGGYLTWRFYPPYLDYIDSRAIPFGSQLFFRAYDLSVSSPGSSAWQREADIRNLNTIIIPLSRYDGLDLFPQLHAFCRSDSWRPVYLDAVSAIFVRRNPQNQPLIDRLQIDCDKTLFEPSINLNSATPKGILITRVQAELFNSLSNAAGILCALGRYPEALTDLDRAQSIFSDNANLYLTRALIFEHTGRPAEAEEAFRTSLKIEPSDETWLDIGLFYMTEKRYAEAVEVFRKAAQSSPRPHDLWMLLGQAYLQMHQPQPALEAFDKAEAASPFQDYDQALSASFNSMVATGRAKAWYQLGNLPKAVGFQEYAVKLAPDDSKLWFGLADLYESEGRTAEAQRARSQVSGH